jgi:hypothetical protein
MRIKRSKRMDLYIHTDAETHRNRTGGREIGGGREGPSKGKKGFPLRADPVQPWETGVMCMLRDIMNERLSPEELFS